MKKIGTLLTLTTTLVLFTGCIDGFRPSAFSPFPARSNATNQNSLPPGATFIEAPRQ